MSAEVVVCRSNAFGAGCGHPITDHTGERTTQTECCCCTRLINDMTHVDGCLDCAVAHGKRQVRIRGIAKTPTTADVEPFIAEGLKRAFWQQYIGRYFESQEGQS